MDREGATSVREGARPKPLARRHGVLSSVTLICGHDSSWRTSRAKGIFQREPQTASGIQWAYNSSLMALFASRCIMRNYRMAIFSDIFF